MKLKVLFILVVYCTVVMVEASEIDKKVEARGKKKGIGLYVYFADIIIKKIFILKLIYAFVFWVVIHKAGYFLAWFVSYLKDQKHHHHEYAHHEHEHVPHHYEHIPYGSPSYGPYRRQNHRNDFRN